MVLTIKIRNEYHNLYKYGKYAVLSKNDIWLTHFTGAHFTNIFGLQPQRG